MESRLRLVEERQQDAHITVVALGVLNLIAVERIRFELKVGVPVDGLVHVASLEVPTMVLPPALTTEMLENAIEAIVRSIDLKEIVSIQVHN